MIKNYEFDEREVMRNLPKNVRQIGEAHEGNRIYMEDYVYTYLHQFAAKNKKEEQIAFLVGEQIVCEGIPVALIQGAIQSKLCKRENGSVEITLDAWDYANDKRKQYFSDLDIIGWVYTQPGYGVLLTSFLITQHQKYFKNEGQVLFVLDPVEKEEIFFEGCQKDLIQKPGFFVFYEKNDAMHEYMLDYKIEQEEIKEVHTDEVVKLFRAKELEKKEEMYHKKFVHMLFALSGALMLMCIIIGMGLLNNIEEMNKLKQSIGAVISTYSTLGDNQEDTVKAPDDTQEVISGDQNQVDTIQPNTDQPVGDSETQIDVDDPEVQPIEPEVPIVDSTEPPTQETTSTTVVIPEKYKVLEGDNLIKISYQFYGTIDMVEAIQERNNIKNPQKIYVGQVLLLP